MLSYYEYLIGGTAQWDRFAMKAPTGSGAFVMVNPPQMIMDKMPTAQMINPGAYDRVIVVSLKDGAKISLKPYESGEQSGTGSMGGSYDADKGKPIVFEMTVPEGMPVKTMEVTAPTGEAVSWDVATLSGRIPLMSTFLSR